MYKHLSRIPLILVIDASKSMLEGEPPAIASINSELQRFFEEVHKNATARIRRHVDVTIISYGGSVNTVLDWCELDKQTTLPVIEARGSSPMGAALVRAISTLQDRLTTYHQSDVRSETAHIWHFTDGVATDLSSSDGSQQKLREFLDNVQAATTGGKPLASIFHVATPEADFRLLRALVSDPGYIVPLQGSSALWAHSFFQLFHASISYSSRLQGEPAAEVMMRARRRAGFSVKD